MSVLAYYNVKADSSVAVQDTLAGGWAYHGCPTAGRTACYLSQGSYVSSAFVCLLAELHNNQWTDIHKIW